MSLDFPLERSVLVCAQRSTVFRHFTEPRCLSAWWGAEGSSVEARPGGAVRIVNPGGSRVLGEVVELVEPSRFVFTYGYEDPARPIPPGGSRVTFTLDEREAGTRVSVRHDVADAKTRDLHVAGWAYQLARLANVAAKEQLTGATGTIDRFFAAWGEEDAAKRASLVRETTTSGVVFRDAFGATEGPGELEAHMAALQAQMRKVSIARDGEPRLCQGTAIVAWVVKNAEGATRGRGEDVIDFAPDGRIARVVGFWAP